MAKRKKLEEQLVEAKKTLAEAEYEHSIQVQEEALNKQYENYENERQQEITNLKASLNDRETILAESFNTVKENASLIGQEIASIAVEHGITISDTLISSWQSGEQAIASYGEVLSQNTSAFIGNIMGVENEVWNLQAQANNTANSLAWMFSTKADNLVNELMTSYYAEANLTNMTNVLQQSLISTLERGYNISSIVNSIASIESAARSAKAALDAMNTSAGNGGGTSGYGSGSGSGGSKGTRDKNYQLIDKMTGKIWKDNLSYAEATELKKDHNVDIHTILQRKYASGTRNAKGGIRIVDEKGDELTLPKLSEGRYAFGNAGDQILTAEQTDNLYELSKMNPDDLIPLKSLTLEDMQRMWANARMTEPVVEKRVNAPVNIDNRVIFNGDVNDLKHLKKQMEEIADRSSIKASNNSIRRLAEGIRH